MFIIEDLSAEMLEEFILKHGSGPFAIAEVNEFVEQKLRLLRPQIVFEHQQACEFLRFAPITRSDQQIPRIATDVLHDLIKQSFTGMLKLERS